MQDDDDLLTCKESCDLLGKITPPTLYRGIHKGKFPKPIKLGPGTARWRRGELKAAIERAAQERQ